MKPFYGRLGFMGLMMCFALSGFMVKSAQELPPLPPAPLPSKSTRKPVPPRGIVQTGQPAAAPVPSIPTPLLHAPPVLPNPALPLAAPAVAMPSQVTNPGALVYDAEQKEYSAKPGEPTASVSFNLTNVSPAEVLVNRVTTSCGYTVAKLPAQPWHLAAGASGPINVTVDLRGKSGTIIKTVTVDSTAGVKSLLVKVMIPPPKLHAAAPMDRGKNMELAKADRQAVFKNDCAECHVKPAIGKSGKQLYASACAVCHDAEHRATMVPNLHVFKHPDTREYWTHSISEGKVNSLMPAFAQKSGGFLTDQQVVSLVDYMTTGFAKDPAVPYVSAAQASQNPQVTPVNTSARLAPVTALGPFPIR